jgi:hypothetical protein
MYGLAASLLMLSVALAIQKTPLRPALETGAETERPASSNAAARSGRGAALSGGVALSEGEDDQSMEPAAAERRTTQRNPMSIQTDGAPPEPPESATARGSVVTASAATQPAWSKALSVLAGVSSGGGGTTAAPATAAPTSMSPPAPTSHGGKVRAVLFGTHEDTVCHSGDREFRLEDVGDLYVCVVWAGLSGKYAERLTFVSPDGHVYQMVTVPFMTTDTPATVDPMIEVDGRKLEAKRAGWGSNGAVLVTTALPVSGTFITQFSLAGVWTVQVGLDGQSLDHDYFELNKE